MLWKLILLLTAVPLAELYLLIQLTELWGSFWLTVGLIVGTGMLGAALARHEGLRVLRKMREQLGRGELPADSLMDGVMILVAGALLLTPGILTDLGGLLLLIPPSRAVAKRMLKRWAGKRIRIGNIHVGSAGRPGPISDAPPPGFPPLEDED